jgi:hypothetical protein
MSFIFRIPLKKGIPMLYQLSIEPEDARKPEKHS